MPASLLDDANDLGNGLFDLGKLTTVCLGGIAALAVEPVGFQCIGAHRLRHHVRGHKTLTQTRQHPVFERLTTDGAGIVATVAEQMVGAGKAILSAPGICAATAAAEHQTGQERARAMGGVHPAVP